MGKIAILTDIHANLPALKSVLRDVMTSDAERIVFLGDIVGYGASPVECLKIVRNLGGCCVMGNHDWEIRNVRQRRHTFRDPESRNNGYLAGLDHAAGCLDADQAEWLANLPFTKRIPGAVVAHASLNQPRAFNYICDDDSALPTIRILQDKKIHVCFFGHTHEAAIFSENPKSLQWLDDMLVRIPPGLACAVTVGAVGQPRHEPEHCASWVLWDPSEGVVEFRKTDYNRLQAAQDIVRAGLPLVSALRLLKPEEGPLLDLSHDNFEN